MRQDRQDRNRILRIANWMAAAVAISAVILIPLGYFTIAHRHIVGNLETEAEINGRIFSGLINQNPEFWQFEQMRLEELLKRRPGSGEKEIRRILNRRDQIVAESADLLKPPLIMRSSLLHDSGVPVGRLEISRSLLSILARTGLIALIGVFIGTLLFLAMRTLPFRAVIKAEDALRKSEAEYRSLFDNMLNGFAFCRMVYDGSRPQDFIFLKINGAFETLTGIENAVGKKVSELIPAIHEKDPGLIEACDRVAASGTAETFEIFVASLSMWFAVSAYSPTKGYFIFIFDAITGRKQAEEALRLSEERFRLFLTNANDAVYVHEVTPDGTGEIIEVNDQACAMLGYRREELLNMAVPDIDVPEQKKNMPAIVRALGETGRIVFETEHVTKGDRRVPVEVSARRLELRGNPIILSVVRDISERKRLEAEHRKLQRQLQQAQKMESVGRLAGGVAHDYNNMLNLIMGYTELSLEQTQPGGMLHDNLTEVLDAARRSEAVTRQLLAFARKQTITPKVLDLNETVASMLKMLRRLIGEDIDLVWKPETEVWPVIMDSTQIDQILANLCVNARDAIDGVGKISIETQNIVIDEIYCSRHAGSQPGSYVMLAVSDDGYGMGKEVLDTLFEPFFTTKEVGKGTGLGLSTVYGIVKQNHGYIDVYSEPGQGAIFRIYFPKVQEERERSQPTQSEAPIAKHTGRILLVEDEPAILRLATSVLEQHGYTVVAAQTPAEALAFAQQQEIPIDLLITDVVMPGMNGQQLKERIEQLRPDIKVLFMSGYTADAVANRGILADGVHFLQKPFSNKSLAQKVQAVLDREE